MFEDGLGIDHIHGAALQGVGGMPWNLVLNDAAISPGVSDGSDDSFYALALQRALQPGLVQYGSGKSVIGQIGSDIGKLGRVWNWRSLAEKSHELTEDGEVPPGVGVLQNVERKVPGGSGKQGRQADPQGIPWPQFRDHVRVWIEPVACRRYQVSQPDGIAVARGVRSAGTFSAKAADPRDEGCRAVQ